MKNKYTKNKKFKSQRYFEQFFIVGIDSASLEEVEKDACKIVPQNLFRYPSLDGGDEVSERAKVVKDFCFPNGVLVKKLNYFYDPQTKS